MSSTTLGERFAETNGEPLVVRGTLVHNMYRRKVSNQTVLRVHRSFAKTKPKQGIRIKVAQGAIVVNGQAQTDAVLWADSAPNDVKVLCETGKSSAGELRVWNCWMDEEGVMQSWIGDAGMVIEGEDTERVSFACSDGTHSFAPSDLTFELLFDDLGGQ